MPLDLGGADIHSMFCKSVSSLVLSFYKVDLQSAVAGMALTMFLRA